MMTEKQTKRLKQYRLRAALACAGIVSLLFSAALLLGLTLTQDNFLDRGQWGLIGPIILVWCFLLRHFPRQWLEIQRDLQGSSVQTVQGTAALYTKPGLLFIPSRSVLLVQGKTFYTDGMPANQLHPGADVQVCYAPASGCLLSVQQLTKHNNSGRDPDQNSTNDVTGLSDRDQVLLRLIGQGLGDKLIARELNLSPSTVRTYNSALYRKLQVKDRKQAIEKAATLGLLNVD